MGARVVGTGEGYGFQEEVFTDERGQACIEVARSENNGADYDRDGISNEQFLILLDVLEPLNQQVLSRPFERTLPTPIVNATCADLERCDPLEIRFRSALPENAIR